MTTRTRIPAAAPAWVRSVLAGPDRPARVVHRGSDAVYVDVDGSCLGALSTAATAVPCAVRTGLPELPPRLLVAEHATVGGGRLALGDTDLVVTRTVAADVPRLGAAEVLGTSRRLTAAVADRAEHVRAELPGDALETLVAGRAEAVPALLGRGSGLTPLGDDVLAGWVATVVAVNGPSDDAPVVDAVARHAPAMTTLLSATLLDCARRGDVIPQFRTLLLALAGPDQRAIDDAVDALLKVGHTSGAGLTLGAVLALRHLASRSHT